MVKTNKRKRLKKFWGLYLMLAPGLIYLLINNYIPMSGIIIAFKRYNYQKGIWGSDFIGLGNFKFLFSTSDSWIIIRNTIAYNLTFITVSLVVGMTLAILLDELNTRKLKQYYQTAFLLPYLISIVVVSYIVNAFLSTDTGFMNKTILASLNLERVSWYSKANFWPLILVIVNQWKWLGYNCVIYYSSIIGINPEFYEAAAIDGATRWQRIKYITVPSVRSTIIIMTLMAIGNIFRSDFGLFYQVPMNSSSLINVTNTIDTYVYRGLMSVNSLGMSSAAGLYQSVIGFAMVLAANQVVRKLSKDSALF